MAGSTGSGGCAVLAELVSSGYAAQTGENSIFDIFIDRQFNALVIS